MVKLPKPGCKYLQLYNKPKNNTSQSEIMMYVLRWHGFMSVQQTLQFSSQSVTLIYLLPGQGFMSVQQTLEYSSY